MNYCDYFYKAFCKRSFTITTKNQINDIEYIFKSTIPLQYRDFILKYKGGVFENSFFNVNKNKKSLDLLYGITPDDKNTDIVDGIHIFDDNDPVSLLPIGVTESGDLIFIIIGNFEDGMIGIKIAFSDDCFKLANDFKSFLKSIYSIH